MRGVILDTGLGEGTSGVTLNAQATKAEIKKRHHIKLRSFCTAKETITRGEKAAQELGEDICTPCICQGLCKNSDSSVTKKPIAQQKRAEKEPEQMILPRTHRNGQTPHRKVLNATGRQGVRS